MRRRSGFPISWSVVEHIGLGDTKHDWNNLAVVEDSWRLACNLLIARHTHRNPAEVVDNRRHPVVEAGYY